jgi:glutamyl-Q tRNA(Asp) synthetase
VSAANANTATGTTATAEAGVAYVGRFAPSPTGALHLGSLTTAAASFLDARHCGGRWLLRIEDLDTSRVVPGAADTMLGTLENLGFAWDGPVMHQSQRLARYQQAVDELARRGQVYACSCSRRDRGGTDDTGGYAGTCRNGPTRPGPAALRFRADLNPVPDLDDRLLGICGPARAAPGDPILRRRDGLYAYQLAVVVDDAEQQVTDVVRGADLLPSTYWQRSLQRALRVPQQRYAHLPLVCEADGSKLSKSAHAINSAISSAPELLWRVLSLLRQSPPLELRTAPPAELWSWAIAHWRLERLGGLVSLNADLRV